MRMVPDVLLGSPPRSEAKVFEMLKSLDFGDGWVVFHSLNCAEHEYKRWSEIDFLVVSRCATERGSSRIAGVPRADEPRDRSGKRAVPCYRSKKIWLNGTG